MCVGLGFWGVFFLGSWKGVVQDQISVYFMLPHSFVTPQLPLLRTKSNNNALEQIPHYSKSVWNLEFSSWQVISRGLLIICSMSRESHAK